MKGMLVARASAAPKNPGHAGIEIYLSQYSSGSQTEMLKVVCQSRAVNLNIGTTAACFQERGIHAASTRLCKRRLSGLKAALQRQTGACESLSPRRMQRRQRLQ
jgi:hypothetical protein